MNATSIYSDQQLRVLDPKRIPKHIAIIPDGNRRWARGKFLLPEEGHRAGADQLMSIVSASIELGVKVLTFYIFSTENWNRPKREINAQLWLLEKYLVEQRQRMVDEGVRFCTIGDLSPFPENIRVAVQDSIQATEAGKKLDLVFSLNYGGRNDITRAVEWIIQEYDRGKIIKEHINEDLISSHLDTSQWPDPDLLIRTSGEHRVSNFLLWQISYTEFYLCDTLWPEFTPVHLLNAVQTFQNRERRLGGS